MNYVSSHDDGCPFDKKREKTFESGTKLLLAPGISQVYYGDESARSLDIPGTKGDATLRSIMNWDDIKTNPETQKVLLHWQKLGNLEKIIQLLEQEFTNKFQLQPYVFSRTFLKEIILIK